MQSNERGDKESASVEILSKAAAVIFVLESDGELTAQGIAERVDEPTSSTYRLLTQLSALGWVERGTRRGLFRLGVFFMRIGGFIEDRIDIRQAASPAMHRLLEETGATSFLCVRRSDRAVCIERFERGEVRSLAMRIGDSLPLHSGAAPLALLAHLPRGDQDHYLGRLAAEEGPQVARRVLQDIAHVMERGYSISDGDVTPGIAAIGAPVYNHRGELEASVSISGLRHRVLSDPEASGAFVLAAAADTSAALGFEVAR